MNKRITSYPLFLVSALLLLLTACNDTRRPPAIDIANTPEQLENKTRELLRELLNYAVENSGDIGDSVFIRNDTLAQLVYKENSFSTIWSGREQWKPVGDSLLDFIEQARLYGLYPEDYHFALLDPIRKRFSRDSSGSTDRRDAALWSRADLLMTDAFLQLVYDLKMGRLPADSVTQRSDSVLTADFYMKKLYALNRTSSMTKVAETLEPTHPGYGLLKAGLKKFLDSADYREFTPVPMPGKDKAAFKKALQTRLYEGNFIAYDSIPADSLELVAAIKAFQKKQGITVDGIAGQGTVRMFNTSDWDKFASIAITMDRYKMLPGEMPSRYVWVNLPSYYMKLIEDDTVALVSKIICGKPATRTPLLTSAIGELITYPQWTIPTSIIVKEILPGMRKDTASLAKKGYSLIDKNGDEVDPQTVEWSKYKKGLPYKVVQGSGDDNALGILKFNFNNKYAVYLHDTNQRYLFAQTVRSLSHGCVRVQEWQKLAYDIVRNENANPTSNKPSAKEDSLNSWLKQKIKRSIYIRNKLPVYIRYFTCEGTDEGIVFYDDMYGEDKFLREKYFAGK